MIWSRWIHIIQGGQFWVKFAWRHLWMPPRILLLQIICYINKYISNPMFSSTESPTSNYGRKKTDCSAPTCSQFLTIAVHVLGYVVNWAPLIHVMEMLFHSIFGLNLTTWIYAVRLGRFYNRCFYSHALKHSYFYRAGLKKFFYKSKC